MKKGRVKILAKKRRKDQRKFHILFSPHTINFDPLPDTEKLMKIRAEWERRAIAIARTSTRHYDVLPPLFLIHSFSTLLIAIFTIAIIKCSVHLYSTFHVLFFFNIITFVFLRTCYLLNTLTTVKP